MDKFVTAQLWKRCAKNYRARWKDVRAKWLAAARENVELKRRRRRRAGQVAATLAGADPSVGGSKA